MDKKFETLIDNATEQITVHGTEVKGVILADKNGLPLANRDVSISPGPIGLLTDLASQLTNRRTTVCLENNEAQVILHQTDKAVVAVYTKTTT